MLLALPTLLGKAVLAGLRLLGRQGSALPGLVIERVAPSYTRRMLARLPHGVAVISGTNGKTTTTKIAADLFETAGLKVFTNPTGSNFGRGVTAALVRTARLNGRIDADIAVLELDEAHAVHFVKDVVPDHCLLLNVTHDQLDRFEGPEQTAGLLAQVAGATTGTVILNRDDEYLARIHSERTAYFGSAEDTRGRDHAPIVLLTSYADGVAAFEIDGEQHSAAMQLRGNYNALNAAGALALVKTVCAQADTARIVAALEHVRPAFGRGERIAVGPHTVELVLVKNTDGFDAALAAFPPSGVRTMLAINDRPADSQDLGWLSAVDFDSLRASGVQIASGARAQEITEVLSAAGVAVAHTTPDPAAAIRQLLDGDPATPKRIYCSYTAMFEVRRLLTG